MEKEFKWGIIGCGGISSKLAQAVDLVEGASVHAAAARNLEKAQELDRKAHV